MLCDVLRVFWHRNKRLGGTKQLFDLVIMPAFVICIFDKLLSILFIVRHHYWLIAASALGEDHLRSVLM